MAASAVPGDAGAAVLAAARQSFVSGMSTATLIGAGVVAAGTVIVALWMPNRARTSAAEMPNDLGAVAGAASVATARAGEGAAG
jgi:hypothetical protein